MISWQTFCDNRRKKYWQLGRSASRTKLARRLHVPSTMTGFITSVHQAWKRLSRLWQCSSPVEFYVSVLLFDHKTTDQLSMELGPLSTASLLLLLLKLYKHASMFSGHWGLIDLTSLNLDSSVELKTPKCNVYKSMALMAWGLRWCESYTNFSYRAGQACNWCLEQLHDIVPICMQGQI